VFTSLLLSKLRYVHLPFNELPAEFSVFLSLHDATIIQEDSKQKINILFIIIFLSCDDVLQYYY
jgi:hypothetical protein